MNKNNWLKHIDFMFIDLISVVLSFLLAYSLRLDSIISIDNYYLLILLIMVFVNILVFFIYNPFKNILKRGYLIELKSVLLTSLLNLAIVVLYLFISKTSTIYSRTVILTTYIINVILSYVTRIMYKKLLIDSYISGKNRHSKSLLIICKNKDTDYLLKNISNNSLYNISGVCFVDKNVRKKTINNIKIININSLLDYISKNWVDEIFISVNLSSLDKELIKGIKDTRIPVHVKFDNLSAFNDRKQIVEDICGYQVVTTVTNARSNYQMLIKRLMDIVGGLIGCLITLLLIVIIGPIIYIKSPGNIFYISDRIGRNGRVFKFYKFRSMVLNADDLKDDLKKKNRVKDGMMFKMDDDPRIIPGIGNFIRKTSIDEFPQFFNVLKGDMSLVGTRPPTLDEWNRYSPYYRSRLSIKPGITGLWQVSGRSNIIDFDKVVKLDNEYIDNFEIRLDIKILFKTFKQLFNKENNGAL